jgi:hypothetical protein
MRLTVRLIRATFISTTWELRYSAFIEGIPERESIRIQVVRVLEDLQRAVEIFQTTGVATDLYQMITHMRPVTLLVRLKVLGSHLWDTQDIKYLNGVIACLDLLRHHSQMPLLLEMSVWSLLERFNRLKTSKDLDRAAELCDLLKGKVPESKRWSLVAHTLLCQLQVTQDGPMEAFNRVLRDLKNTLKVTPPGASSPNRVEILRGLTLGMTGRFISMKPFEPWDDDKFDEAVAIAKQWLHASEAHPEDELVKLSAPQECLSTLFFLRSRRNKKASDRHETLIYERRKRPNVGNWNNISPGLWFNQQLLFAGKLSDSKDPEHLVEAVSILSDLKNAIPSGDTGCTESFLKILVSVGRSIDSRAMGSFFDSVTEAQRRLQDLVSQLDIESLGAVSEDTLERVNIFLHRRRVWASPPFNTVAFEDYSRNLLRLCPTEEELKRQTCCLRLGLRMIIRAGAQNDMNLMNEGALLLEQASYSASHDDPLAQMQLSGGYGGLYCTTMDSNHLNKALHHGALAILAEKSPQGRLVAVELWYETATVARILSNHPPPRRDWGFALDVAIDSITQLAGLEATVAKRHEILRGRPSWLPCIVSTLIADGELPKALESLERIRGFVWNQLNSLRTPMDDLRSCNPAIADRLKFLSQRLEIAGRRVFSLEERLSGTDGQKIANQDEEAAHFRMAEEYEELVRTVQTTIPGFKYFLRPPCLNDWLEHLPPTGLVVLIVMSTIGCNAIILGSGAQPGRIPLLDFSWKKAEELQIILRSSLMENGLIRRERTEPFEESRLARPAAKKTRTHSQIVSSILRELWMLVVKPILRQLRFPVSECF